MATRKVVQGKQAILSGAEEWCTDTLLRSGSRDFAARARAMFGSSVRVDVIAAQAERRCAGNEGEKT